jgi:hypothetical protein
MNSQLQVSPGKEGEDMEKKLQRPTVITAIGSLNLISGSVLMLGAFGAPQGAEGAALFGAGLASLVVGSGLLRLRPWARKVAIGGYLANLIVGIATVNPLMMGIASLILPCLFSDRVKEAFAPQPVAAPHVINPFLEEKHAA